MKSEKKKKGISFVLLNEGRISVGLVDDKKWKFFYVHN